MGEGVGECRKASPDTSDTGSFQVKNKAFRLFHKENVPVDSASGETTSVVRKREKQFVSARMVLGGC